MTGTALGTGGTITAEKSASESESLYWMSEVQDEKIKCQLWSKLPTKANVELLLNSFLLSDSKSEKLLHNLQFGHRHLGCVSANKVAIFEEKKRGGGGQLKGV